MYKCICIQRYMNNAPTNAQTETHLHIQPQLKTHGKIFVVKPFIGAIGIGFYLHYHEIRISLEANLYVYYHTRKKGDV